MRRYLLPLLGAAAMQAGILDFQTLQQAKAAYEDGNYSEAAARYGDVKAKNEQARFNYADALYKEKKYAEAADVFSGITDPALKRQALHNLGNSLAFSGKPEEAIKAYEASLKLGDDEDTRYNLELLKKQQEQKNKEQQNDQNDQKEKDQKNNQQDQQQNDQQQNRDGKGQDQKQDQDQQNKDQKGQDGQEKKDQKQQDRQDGDKQDERRDAEQQEQNKQEQQAADAQQKENGDKQEAEAQAAMAEPISDMEERKYNKMLDKRGIKTLMIPLSGKGEPHDDETTPW
ncbi:MAG: tetratricopeptide repeat protein [Campylobacterales bacterium]|nr:tetratricopeptide repeat protein [Campylobacterales bacterium]